MSKLILVHSLEFYYDDDPDHKFTSPYSVIATEFHISYRDVSKSIKELLASKYWILVSAGSKNRSAEYRHNHDLLTIYIE